MQQEVIIILLPNGRWCLQVDGERSAPHPYSELIIFNGFMALTDYYGHRAGVYEVTHQPQFNEVVDETTAT